MSLAYETRFFREVKQALERLSSTYQNNAPLSLSTSLQLPSTFNRQIMECLSIVTTVDKFGGVKQFEVRDKQEGLNQLEIVYSLLSYGVVQLVYFQEFVINEKSPTLQHYLHSDKLMRKESALQTWNLLFRGLSTLNSDLIESLLQNANVSIQMLVETAHLSTDRTKLSTYFEKQYTILRALRKLSRENVSMSIDLMNKDNVSNSQSIHTRDSVTKSIGDSLSGSLNGTGFMSKIGNRTSATVVTLSTNQIRDLSPVNMQRNRVNINNVQMSINEQAFTAYDPVLDESQDEDEFVEMGIQDSIINFPTSNRRRDYLEDSFSPNMSLEASPATRKSVLGTTDTPPYPGYLSKLNNNSFDSSYEEEKHEAYDVDNTSNRHSTNINSIDSKISKQFQGFPKEKEPTSLKNNKSQAYFEEEKAEYDSNHDEWDTADRSMDIQSTNVHNEYNNVIDDDFANQTTLQNEEELSNHQDKDSFTNLQLSSVENESYNQSTQFKVSHQDVHTSSDEESINNDSHIYDEKSYHPEMYTDDTEFEEEYHGSDSEDLKDDGNRVSSSSNFSPEDNALQQMNQSHRLSQKNSAGTDSSDQNSNCYSSTSIDNSTPGTPNQDKIKFTSPRVRPTTSTTSNKDFWSDAKNPNDFDHRRRSLAQFDEINNEARSTLLVPQKFEHLSESEQLRQIKKENQLLRMMLLDQKMRTEKERQGWNSKLKEEVIKARTEVMRQTAKIRPSSVQGARSTPNVSTINTSSIGPESNSVGPQRRPSTTPGGSRGIHLRTEDALSTSSKAKSTLAPNSARVKSASNKTMIENAIQRACFPGKINEESRFQALEAIDSTPSDRYIISLARENSTSCRGIYAIDNTSDNAVAYRIYGKGPKKFTSKSVRSFFRYNSTTKAFLPQESKSFTVSDLRIDAVLLVRSAKVKVPA